MKYFLDTEFIEDFYKPLFGKHRHYIDLISIGIVAEDGREYYAISNEFDVNHVWNKKDTWVRDNVLKNIFDELHFRFVFRDDYKGSSDMKFTSHNLRYLISKFGKSNKDITQEIIRFVMPSKEDVTPMNFSDYQKRFGSPEFYGYYADYDWVLFCSLFGRMIDLPKGFPMYCRDLKQMLDEVVMKMSSGELSRITHPGVKHNVFSSLDSSGQLDKVKEIKTHPRYPQQLNAHNALDDARWNKKLYDFINTL